MSLNPEWDYIQLHFKIAPYEINDLRNSLKENYLHAGIISVVDISNLGEYNVKELSKVSEILLFDSSIRGGTGKLASRKHWQKYHK